MNIAPIELERILLAGPLEHVRGQRLAADVLLPRANLVERAAGHRVVALEHLEVPCSSLVCAMNAARMGKWSGVMLDAARAIHRDPSITCWRRLKSSAR